MKVANTYFGQSMPRVEDDRLLRGKGRFIDDYRPEGLLHAVILRASRTRAAISRMTAVSGVMGG